MGYGGNLIWTTVFKALNEREGRAVAPVHMPRASDLAAGRLYDADTDLRDDPIYRGNPRLFFAPRRPKGAVARLVDRGFVRLLSLAGQRERYERWIVARAARADDGRAPMLVHVDMRIHSYAAAQERRRTVWKAAPRAATAMLEHLGGGTASDDCEMYFAADEHREAARVLDEAGVAGPFVAVEPETNTAYFGDLRAWPRESWQATVERVRRARSDVAIVQLGVGTAPALEGAVDLRNRTSFRVAALLLAKARLFVGTEGGLMHAANAVGARALILWGGITLPEFIGYPTRQRTLCKYVACAPCGQNGWCDNGRICMRTIAVDEVFGAVLEMLEPT